MCVRCSTALRATCSGVFCWHHLGRALAGLGDAGGAADTWRRGVEAVRGAVEPSPADSLPYASLLGQQMGQGCLDPGLLDEARARFPDNHLIAWLDGRRLVAAGRHEEAIGVFQTLAAVDADTFMDEAIAYDARIFRVWPLDALGLCCFRLGRFEDSARYYARAEAAADDAAPYHARRQLAEARLGRAAAVRVSPPPPPS